jgi:hypothetical protein
METRVKNTVAELTARGLTPPFPYELAAGRHRIGPEVLKIMQGRGLLAAPAPPPDDGVPSAMRSWKATVLKRVKRAGLSLPLDREYMTHLGATPGKVLDFLEETGVINPALQGSDRAAIAILREAFPRGRHVQDDEPLVNRFLREMSTGLRQVDIPANLRGIKEMLYHRTCGTFGIWRRIRWVAWKERGLHPLDHPLVSLGVNCRGGRVRAVATYWPKQGLPDAREINLDAGGCLEFFGITAPVAGQLYTQYAGRRACYQRHWMQHLQKITCEVQQWVDRDNFRLLIVSGPT